jgi:ubiquinone/menaquinone biosynthesis C-methylase UbiE
MAEFQPQERVTSHFDSLAKPYFEWYKARNQDGHSFRIRRTRCLEQLAKLSSGSTVLDVACGPATFVEDLRKRGYKFIGLDIAPHMIELSKELYGSDPDCSFIVANAEQIPLPDRSVEGLAAMGLMEYVNDESKILVECLRVAKPGALFTVTYPHRMSPARIWDRLTHAIAKPILQIVRKGKSGPGVKHREYDLTPTLAALKKAGWNVDDVVFYNMKIALRPLDKIFPALACWISEQLERFGRTPILRRLGTGFIVTVSAPK